MLFGETAPIGNANVVSPLALPARRDVPELQLRKTRGCAKLRIDGYAHHAYTRKSGPNFCHPEGDDVSIGALDRLVAALDRAARAGVIDRAARST